MSVLNELVEHRRWELVEYLLKTLGDKEAQRKAVMAKEYNSTYPESLYVMASQKERTLHNIFKKLGVLPDIDDRTNSLPNNQPTQPPPSPKTGLNGTALIINISFKEENAKQDLRIGGDSSHDKLGKAFAELHVDVISLPEEATKDQLCSLINNLEVHGKLFFLAIQTHGAFGKLALSDETIEVQQLLENIDEHLADEIVKVSVSS